MRILIVTPTYNVARFLGDTITSVRAQTHSDWLMRVVDDGSTDGTASVARAFDDARITVVQGARAGVSAARNRALASIEGDAVLFLDGDDWLAPDALARLAAALAPGTVAAYGPYCFVSEDGGTELERKSGPFPRGDILRRLLVENLFANGGHMLICAEAIGRAGLFRADLRYGEDWEYWCRLAALRRADRGRAAGTVAPTHRGGESLDHRARNGSPRRPCPGPRLAAPLLACRAHAETHAAARGRARARAAAARAARPLPGLCTGALTAGVGWLECL
jgi:glycosyltransferase involved in cell wall biosynthesis